MKTRYVSRFIICVTFFLMLILGYCGHDRLMWTNLVNPRINHPLFHQKGVGIKHDTSRVYYWSKVPKSQPRSLLHRRSETRSWNSVTKMIAWQPKSKVVEISAPATQKKPSEQPLCAPTRTVLLIGVPQCYPILYHIHLTPPDAF